MENNNIKELAKIKNVFARQIMGGYRYFAELNDGSEVVLRKKATRLYARAFIWRGDHHPGQGLAGHFTYGKTPSGWDMANDELLANYPVTLKS